MADNRERGDLALELAGRVAVHVGEVAHLGGVPQAAGLVDALEPRHTVEELRDEDDYELRPALALRAATEVVVDAGSAEERALKGPAIAHPLDVAVELAPVDGFGGNDHARILARARACVKAVYRTLTWTSVPLRTRRFRSRRRRAGRRTPRRPSRGRPSAPRRRPRRASRRRA